MVMTDEPANLMVFHIRRIKTMTGCFNVLQHNRRENGNEDKYSNLELSVFNVLEGPGALDFTDVYNQMIEDARLTRKRQKNASPLIEFTISTSHLFKNDWLTNPESKAVLDQYFK
jgi:hypothetical protein